MDKLVAALAGTNSSPWVTEQAAGADNARRQGAGHEAYDQTGTDEQARVTRPEQPTPPPKSAAVDH